MQSFPLDTVLERCGKQDRRAQEQLYNFTYSKLIGTALRYNKSREDANWVFNLAMLKVYKNVKKFKIGTNYLGWANDILIKTSIDNIRSNNRHSKVMAPVESSMIEANNAELNQALNDLATEQIFELIQKLSNNERLVFSMYVIDGFKHREIEEQTGIKANTSKWLLSKAKLELQKQINKLNQIKLSQ